MLIYALKRLGLAVVVAVVVSALAFLLLRASGDVALALAGEGARSEDIENIRRIYGLDRPLIVQYLDWASKMARGDFGTSLFFKTEVHALVLEKLPTTALLALFSLIFALAVSLPLGILAALYPNSWIDRLCLALAVIGQALPSFFFALILMIVFAVTLRWLPVSGSDSWAHFVLPTVVLGYYIAPAIMRLVRAGMIEVLASDYVRTARAKGMDEQRVLVGHVLRNALIPLVTVVGIDVPLYLTGAVLTETVFSWPGMGRLFFDALTVRDYPILMGILLLGAVLIVLGNLIADVLYGVLDPRISY